MFKRIQKSNAKMTLKIIFILMEIGLSFGGDEQLSQTLIPKLETYKWHEQMCSLLGGHIGSENEIVDYFSKNR